MNKSYFRYLMQLLLTAPQNGYSQRNNNINIRIPSFEEYWNHRLQDGIESFKDGMPTTKTDDKGVVTTLKAEAFPIIIDLRASGGFTNKQEPAIGRDDIRVNIKLRKPLTEEYKWVFNMGSYSEWNVIQPQEGGLDISYTNNTGTANIYKNRI